MVFLCKVTFAVYRVEVIIIVVILVHHLHWDMLQNHKAGGEHAAESLACRAREHFEDKEVLTNVAHHVGAFGRYFKDRDIFDELLAVTFLGREALYF